MTVAESAPAPSLIIDQETLDHLPAFHKAIAEVLIERGRWQLADGENKDSRKAPAKACLSDIQRTTYDSSCIDVEV
jgi:hypothetical protein